MELKNISFQYGKVALAVRTQKLHGVFGAGITIPLIKDKVLANTSCQQVYAGLFGKWTIRLASPQTSNLSNLWNNKGLDAS